MDGESGLDSPSRRNVLKSAAAVPLLPVLGLRPPSGGRALPKNLLVLVADDMSRFRSGHADTTPTLDRLAADGASFPRAYVPVPICQPARSCMYTGTHPQRCGVFGFGPVRAGVPTWPEVLGEADCTTAMIGKLHVAPLERFRFDYMKGGVPFVDDRSPSAFTVAFAELLDRVGEDRFAAVINFGDPHRPFEGSEVTAREKNPAWEPHDPADVALPPSFVDTPQTRIDLAAYFDAVRRLDATVGRLLELLDARGAREETLVIFTADNGMSFPFAKTTLYEAGINVPMIARWPGVIPAGSTSEALVGLIDLLPTAIEAFAAEPPDELDGRSLLPLMRGEDFDRDAIFASHSEHKRGREAPARSIRRGRFKYIHNFRPDVEFHNNAMGTETWKSWEREARDHPELAARLRRLRFRPGSELFDLEADPWELANLAGDPDHETLEKELRGRLKEWLLSLGDAYAQELTDS